MLANEPDIRKNIARYSLINVRIYIRNCHEGTASEVEENEYGHAVLPATHLFTFCEVEDDAGPVGDIWAISEIVKPQDRYQAKDSCTQQKKKIV